MKNLFTLLVFLFGIVSFSNAQEDNRAPKSGSEEVQQLAEEVKEATEKVNTKTNRLTREAKNDEQFGEQETIPAPAQSDGE